MQRGLSPILGIVLLVAVTVSLSATVLVASPEIGTESQKMVHFSVAADGDTGEIVLTHEGGDTVDATRLQVEIEIDGEPLAHQPPVPFFSATGFHSGPTGPFNHKSDPEWRAGETASLRVASTNDPQLVAGSRVTVRITSDSSVLYEETVTA